MEKEKEKEKERRVGGDRQSNSNKVSRSRMGVCSYLGWPLSGEMSMNADRARPGALF